MITTQATTPSPSRRRLVIDLQEVSPADLVGAKAAPLAHAAAAGHRVPPGVVLTTAAFRAGLAAIGDELEAAVRGLGEGPFAVRSSAVAEDGILRSFAGQLETELGVTPEGLAEAIQRCWASASALRALRYAGGDVGPVAVIVQAMVPASVAGVAFSADPQTGERGVTLVEAVRGLGDSLVSGSADPETWRVDAGAQKRTRSNGAPVLTAQQVERIARLARDMEALFGRPQDVEWAIAGDDLFLLQSRPITALPAEPVPIPIEAPRVAWNRDDHHAVLSPLGWAWFQPYPKAMGDSMRELDMPLERVETTRIGGHLYLRFVMAGGDSQRVPPRWVLWLASRLVPSLRRANKVAIELLDRDGYLEPLARWEREIRPAMRRAIDEIFVEDPTTLSNPELLDRISRSLELTAVGLRHHAELGGPGMFGIGKLRLFLEDHLGWKGEEVHALVTGSSAATTELHRQIEAIIDEHEDELEAAGELPRTWTALASRCPKLGAKLAAWLSDNRLRMLHYDPKHPSLGERPEYVLSIAEGIVLARRSGETQTCEEAREAARELLARAEAQLSPERMTELRDLLEKVQRVHGLRDANGVETVSRPAGLLRHFVLELGRRIEKDIGAREHAVYLYPEEHAPALAGTLPNIAELVERRRGEESWALANRGPKRYGPPEPPMPAFDAFPSGLARVMRILSWMMETENVPEPEDGDLIAGCGIGSRIVTGKARVIRNPEELALVRHGEIVVCRITSPEWAVGLGRVAALVTNEGGSLSHPAIIAREFGMTAIVGAANATTRIASGDTIRVDPVAGTVTVL